MSDLTREIQKLTQKLYQDNKKTFDLLSEKQTPIGLAPAVKRLFGDAPHPGKPIRLGGIKVQYSSHTENRLRFLPNLWTEELAKTRRLWSGCEKWWAGYPFIAWIELSSADGVKGQLTLSAELGPLADHELRVAFIDAITTAASQQDLERIKFPKGSTEKGRLYSQFFRKSALAVSEIRDSSEIERTMTSLAANFRPEFEVVASAIEKVARR